MLLRADNWHQCALQQFSYHLVNVGPLGILLEGNFSPVSLGLKRLYHFPHVILLPLLVEFPDPWHIVLTLSNDLETSTCREWGHFHVS